MPLTDECHGKTMDVWRSIVAHFFHLKTLAASMAVLSIASMSSAAGLDRSGQDITVFLQDGVYAEISYSYIDADISGYDSANQIPSSHTYIQGNKTGNIAESYDFFRYGVKSDIDDTFSVAILYDEPFGANAKYSGDSNFVSKGDINASITGLTGGQFDAKTVGPEIDRLTGLATTAATEALRAQAAAQAATLTNAVRAATVEASTAGESTQAKVHSQNITAILGAKFGAHKNLQVYAGPVAQRIEAETKLRGLAYGPGTSYTLNATPDQDYGWIGGLAYSKPEIALKAAITYRSEITHSMKTMETYPILEQIALDAGASPAAAAAAATQNGSMRVTTPQSINFDFQTGINPSTLATAKVRWVPWSDFKIVPPLYNAVSKGNSANGPDGLAFVDYSKDQWQVDFGLAKRISPVLALSGNIGWDSGAGDPVASLGPIAGYYSAGLGAKYNVTKNWAISAGGKYLWFGDAKGELATRKLVGDFQDNHGYAFGFKLSYQAKQYFN